MEFYKKTLFKEFLFTLVLVLPLHIIALQHDWYWNKGELDSFMHFLGGALVSFGILWIYFFSNFFNPPKRNFIHFFYVSFLGLVFASVSWEIYELIAEMTFVTTENYVYDTSLDFIMDFLGSLAACLYGYMKDNFPTPTSVIKKVEAPENLPV